MKIFVWQDVEIVSRREHAGGGLLIVSESLETAKSEWKAYATENDLRPEGSIPGKQYTHELSEPTLEIMLLEPIEKRIIVFPNAGCC